MNKEVPEKKLFYLDGARGVAALSVVISHYIQVFYPAALNGNSQQAHFQWDTLYGYSPLNLFYNRQFAVCLFFVLSGYVLSVKLKQLFLIRFSILMLLLIILYYGL